VQVVPTATAPASLTVHADADRLRQAVMIALDNAVRYSRPGGTVRLSWRLQPEWVEIRVADEGIGIDPEDMALVFERFARGQRARAHRADGTGIGLSIAQSIIQAHHGHIRLESIPHRGTTVHIDLPRRRGDTAAVP
jgi:two-component system, OmpR family, sensor kinase